MGLYRNQSFFVVAKQPELKKNTTSCVGLLCVHLFFSSSNVSIAIASPLTLMDGVMNAQLCYVKFALFMYSVYSQFALLSKLQVQWSFSCYACSFC